MHHYNLVQPRLFPAIVTHDLKHIYENIRTYEHANIVHFKSWTASVCVLWANLILSNIQTLLYTVDWQVQFYFAFQECPSGVVNEETFKDIYSQFFPQGGLFLFLAARVAFPCCFCISSLLDTSVSFTHVNKKLASVLRSLTCISVDVLRQGEGEG